MNQVAGQDDGAMIPFLNSLATTVIFYASVTRGALVVARGLQRLVRKPS